MTYIGSLGYSRGPGNLYGSLGDTAAMTVDESKLNQSLVPVLGPAVPRGQIQTIDQAAAYAAGGFHVSVTEALKYAKGTMAHVAWAAAATAYYDAYDMTKPGLLATV